MPNQVSVSEPPARQAKGADPASQQQRLPLLIDSRVDAGVLQGMQAQMDRSPQAQRMRSLQSKAAASPLTQFVTRHKPAAKGPAAAVPADETMQRKGSVQLAGAPVVQRFAATLAVIHPIMGRSVIMNRYDDVAGIYLYHHNDASLRISYNATLNQFYDGQNGAIAAPADFNEDAGPVARIASAQNTFRELEFHTDGENRVVRARGRIHRNGGTAETGRSSDAQSGAWDHVQGIHRRMFKPLKEFNGGHIIAHHFGGSPGTDNMVPMEKKYNQNGSYKRFENALDVLLAIESPLTIDVSVSYAADYNTLMGLLVTSDNGNKVGQIGADNELSDIIVRTLGRIPTGIVVNSLMNGANMDVKPGNPDSPMSTLGGTIPGNFSLNTIRKEEFDKTGKGRDGDRSNKTFKPFEKSFGPKKRGRIDKSKNYHADYQTIYQDMPKPGITNYYPSGNGLAGGVRAYIWIDPMGAMNRHGGSDTIDTVDPAGINWNYLRKAVASGARNKIYKKGHLLNASLHGPGADSRNLLPITTLANGDMSRNFEEPVKKSEALINPAKGVIWETRTSGALVTRPPTWTVFAAAGHSSGGLYNEEAKMPQYIDCIAWEAIQHKGVIEQGRTIVSHRVWNKHPGDADGVLGETRAGGQANDVAISARLPANNNNVRGHATVTPLAAQQGGHARGYALDHQWLLLNLPLLAEFKRGAFEQGYDLGFAQQGAGSQNNWHPDVASEFLKGYRKGQERYQYSMGLHNSAFVAPVSPDDRLNGRYLDGRYARGKEIGKALGAQPLAAAPQDPILQGYTDGLYERGKEDANRGLVMAGPEPHYMQGYAKEYGNSAYDHGYDLLAPPQPYATFEASVYGEAYVQGQYDRGYDDGNDLADFQNGQTEDYTDGFRSGSFERGRDDGYDGDARASDDGDYAAGYSLGIKESEFDRGRDDGYANRAMNGPQEDYGDGYLAGAEDRSFDDGYDLLPPTFPMSHKPFADRYREGVEERGTDDGYQGRIVPDNYPEPYLAAYAHGIEIRNEEEEDARD
jgi:hypothetical protein